MISNFLSLLFTCRKSKLLLAFACLQFSWVEAQIVKESCEYFVEGYVFDISTKEALPFANVRVKGTSEGIITNEEGFFRIKNLCYREFDLIVSFVGFKTVTHHHDTYHEVPHIMLAPENYQLESIVVEGVSIPGEMYSGTVEVLSSEEFEQNKSQNLGDLAGRITGVNTLKTGQNVVKPIIHGLHSNRVLIVNNGVRHEFQNWGAEHAPEIDPSLAENINVLKGAATVRYGPDALGGVLVIEPSKLELLTPLQGEAEMVAKTNGRSGDGHLQLKKGFHKVALQAQAAYVHQGDLQSPDYRLSNTGKRELSASLAARYHWRFLDLFAHYSHFQQDLGILRGSVTGSLSDLAQAIESPEPLLTSEFEYQIDNPRQQVNHDVLKFRGLISTDRQSLEATYAIQFNHRLEFDVRRGTNNERPAIDLQLMTQSLDLEWKHPEFFNWQGKIGVQSLYQDNNNLPGTNTVPFIPNYNNFRVGLYMIEAVKYNKLRLEWGLRYDFQNTNIRGRKPNNDLYRDELNFQNVTATVGVLQQINEFSFFRSNIGTAWRPPNVSELYSFGKHAASIEYGLWRYERLENNQIVADDVLNQREKPVSSEIGIKWINTYEFNRGPLQAEFTAYVNFIQNYIYTTPAGITQTVRGAFPYFIYEQDDALLTGFDASLRLKHHNQLHSDVKLSFLWAKNLEQNDFFVGLPPASIQYALSYQLPTLIGLSNSKLAADASYTFEQFFAPRVIPIRSILEAKENGDNIFTENTTDFDILPPPDAYLLFNLGWSAEAGDFLFGVQVKNVFNARYRNYTDRLRYFADEIGRNYVFSLKYQF